MKHESGFTQFRADGTPLVSPTGDVGIMQLHVATWKKTAQKMGLDIENSTVDNMEFGIWLYQKEGPKPWSTYKQYCLGADTS